MRKNEHLVLCGGVASSDAVNSRVLQVGLHGPVPNVRLRIQNISERLVADIPDELVDLLEVASYVYAADSAISRGGRTDAQMGARWRRKLRFVIPVRCPDLWLSTPVSSALVDTLGFLSDDDYDFEFRSLDERPAMQSYLEFSREGVEAFAPSEVILFSGGLDSFAGAVEELTDGRSVALVSHRSASKIAAVQKRLVIQLRDRFGTDRVLHVPVWANLDESLGLEPTHRTRSFLFAALGAVTARLFGVDRIKFFENGVVSLNLPPVAQVVGARATRTTHPKVLAGFRKVLSEVCQRPFDVVNPFIWMTKAEVVSRIYANGLGNLIRDSRSCTRVHDMTTLHPHCGRCSQCIDRRFAILAAGQEHEDPEDAYEVDLFTGERPAGSDREMALAYVRSASDVNQMADVAFFSRYGEASRAIGFFPQPTSTVAESIFGLHRRLAAAVCRVFEQAISSHAADLRRGSLPSTCLLVLVVGQRVARADTGYPKRGQPEKWTYAARREIRMTIHADHRRVVFDGWGEIGGRGAELLIFLAGPHRQAVTKGCAPENYPFTPTADLLKGLRVKSPETLRRRVLRCRNVVERLAGEAGDAPPSVDALIETSQWHGYRLNPDVVRILAVTAFVTPE